MTEGHVLWELLSDYAYVIFTIVGAAIVWSIFYVQRRRAGYYSRERK